MLLHAKTGQYSLKSDSLNSCFRFRCSDHLTSNQSSAAYDVEELRDYLSIVQRIKGTLCRYSKVCANPVSQVPPKNKRMEQCHAAIVIGEA